MIRTIERGTMFDRYTDKCYKKYQNRKNDIRKIDKDLDFVTNLLKQDLPIPPRFKDHKVADNSEFGTQIRELHLISYGSDCLLVYTKYTNKLGIPMLYYYAITDHDGMNKILHGSVLLIDLPEKTVDMILDNRLTY